MVKTDIHKKKKKETSNYRDTCDVLELCGVKNVSPSTKEQAGSEDLLKISECSECVLMLALVMSRTQDIAPVLLFSVKLAAWVFMWNHFTAKMTIDVDVWSNQVKMKINS